MPLAPRAVAIAQQHNDGDNDAQSAERHRCIEDQVAKAHASDSSRPLRIRHNLPGTQQPFGLLHCLHALRLLTLAHQANLLPRTAYPGASTTTKEYIGNAT
jgi:hypothetical protein